MARGLRAAPTHSGPRPPPPPRAPAPARGPWHPRGARAQARESELGSLDAACGEKCGPGGASGDGQGARPGREEGRAGVANGPGRARPGRRRAPACAHGAEAEGRHPLPGLGGGPRQARGRERGRGAPAGGRVTRLSPFPLSLPVADAAAPAAQRAEDWTAEPRAAAAAAERPLRCRDPLPGGGGRGFHRPGPLPRSSSHPSARLLPLSPPPGPEPRAPRLGTGRGGQGRR